MDLLTFLEQILLFNKTEHMISREETLLGKRLGEGLYGAWMQSIKKKHINFTLWARKCVEHIYTFSQLLLQQFQKCYHHSLMLKKWVHRSSSFPKITQFSSRGEREPCPYIGSQWPPSKFSDTEMHTEWAPAMVPRRQRSISQFKWETLIQTMKRKRHYCSESVNVSCDPSVGEFLGGQPLFLFNIWCSWGFSFLSSI